MTKLRWRPSGLAPLLTALFALAAGCGGGGGEPTTGPPAVIFSSLGLTPSDAMVCLVDPGNTVALIATPRDQIGQAMSSLSGPLFTSSDVRIATVAANGLVRAIAAGSTQITASLTVTGTTRTGFARITVANAVAGDASGSVGGNHALPHVAVLRAAELGAGQALSLGIQGQAFHSHTLSLTDRQVQLIAAGCRVTQVSSEDPHSDGTGAHAHTVTFN